MSDTAIYIVSGGNGASGELVVHTVLAQFPEAEVRIVTKAFVSDRAELERIFALAQRDGGTIVHTLVDEELRSVLFGIAEERGVNTVDLMGDLMAQMSEVLGQSPINSPGRYRQLHLEYFERVDAIDFALAHDDGMRISELGQADIVLIGPSRVGKTPLTMYLSVLGWKTANVPLIPDIAPPKQLFEIDRRRVIGLVMEPQNLLIYRTKRHRKLGLGRGGGAYTDPNQLFEEVEAVERLYKRSGFACVNMTEHPIESTASAVIDIIKARFGDAARRPPG